MALINCQFFSEAIGVQSQMTVVLPQSPTPPGGWPCVWLLHGLSDNHSVWQRRTSVERYAEAHGFAVVMPDVQRSFYADMYRGGAYWTFVSDELPRLARSFFPFSLERRCNALAGLSMGGYGAFKWGLRKPDFAMAAASLSGVLDIVDRVRMARTGLDQSLRQETLSLVYGDRELKGTEDDLFALASLRKDEGNGPAMLQICGTEDFLYPDNLRFRDHCRDIGLSVDYREGPGTHDWAFWDQEIQTVFRWLVQLGFGRSTASPA
jgi:putative tributyrin esterase